MTGKTPRRSKKKEIILGITKPAISRIARRAGVKRINALIYNEFREGQENMKSFIEKVVKDAIVFTEYNKRKTITLNDILNSLKRQNRILYGYDNIKPKSSSVKPKTKKPTSKPYINIYGYQQENPPNKEPTEKKPPAEKELKYFKEKYSQNNQSASAINPEQERAERAIQLILENKLN